MRNFPVKSFQTFIFRKLHGPFRAQQLLSMSAFNHINKTLWLRHKEQNEKNFKTLQWLQWSPSGLFLFCFSRIWFWKFQKKTNTTEPVSISAHTHVDALQTAQCFHWVWPASLHVPSSWLDCDSFYCWEHVCVQELMVSCQCGRKHSFCWSTCRIRVCVAVKFKQWHEIKKLCSLFWPNRRRVTSRSQPRWRAAWPPLLRQDWQPVRSTTSPSPEKSTGGGEARAPPNSWPVRFLPLFVLY